MVRTTIIFHPVVLIRCSLLPVNPKNCGSSQMVVTEDTARFNQRNMPPGSQLSLIRTFCGGENRQDGCQCYNNFCARLQAESCSTQRGSGLSLTPKTYRPIRRKGIIELVARKLFNA